MNHEPPDRAVEPDVFAERVDRRAFVLAGGLAVVAVACAAKTDGSATSPTFATSPSSSSMTPPAASEQSGASTSTGTGATTAETGPATIAETASANSALTLADFEALGTCTLFSEKTSGPFPLDEQFDRRDITEGYQGHPLRLGLRVVDASCNPVPGAVVEIWHTDASGDYSAFTDGGGGQDEGPGTTFLRGSQAAGADGIVEFMSLYPGWYRGRAVHIHLRVHVGDATVLTSQLFFDDAYTAEVLATGEYASNGLPDTPNSSDPIAGDPDAEGSLLHLAAGDTTNGTGTLALLSLGIDPTAAPAVG